MSDLVQRLEALTPEQRAQLHARLHEQRGGYVGEHPLSYIQWIMWFVHQLAPESPSYNVALPVRIRTAVAADPLRRALNVLADRHAALRTTYSDRDGERVQTVHERLPVAFEERDAVDMDEPALTAAMRADIERPFDLATGPVWRTTLYHRSRSECVFLLVAHHIAVDLWTVSVMVEELQAIYPALVRGEPPVLPRPTAQYPDFVRWQRELVQSTEGDRHWKYWERQLADALEPLDLPYDFPRPRFQRFRGASAVFVIEPELRAGLHQFARSEGASLHSVLLAAYQALLFRYAGHRTVVVGSPVVGRTQPRFARSVGCHINFLPLRADFTGDPTFREVVQRVYATVLEGLEHQDFPFSLITERLQVARDPSRPVLSQVGFSLDKALHLSAREEEGEVPVEPLPWLAQQEGQFDLYLILSDLENRGRIFGAMRYNSDLFTDATGEGMARDYQRLLERVVADPEVRVSELSVLTPAEREEVLEGWNRTEGPLPPQSAWELFEMQAARTPQAVAVRDGSLAWSYSELRDSAQALAARLREWGVERETVVGVLGPREPWLLRAMLGIWAAGGAYLPMDPRQPPARHAQVLRQAGCTRVLVAREQAEALEAVRPWLEGGGLASLDWEAEAEVTHPLPPGSGASSALAYVIFTSGSTGRPKGAMLEHRGLANHLWAKVHTLRLGAGDVVAQTASQSFDISLWQFVAPLLVGARVEILEDAAVHDPVRLLAEVRAEGVTVLEVVPSLLGVLVELEEAARGAGALRWLLATGEPLPVELARRWLARYPAVPLVNAYGPTECSDDVTQFVLKSLPPAEAVRVPIGRPLANTRLYVLDEHLATVPVGVAGELYVGGAGVGRGYVGEPARTAAAFGPDPFGAAPGSRLYRTGDRVRWNTRGELEFLGRQDDQVKIRGHRVELGEIESILRRHPQVADAAVVAGADRLGAYVTLRQGGGNGADPPWPQLRRFLRERLPEHMVPATWVRLPAMPLTAHGKLDRSALPPAEGESPRAAEYVPPQTPEEATLAAIWADLLGVERVGVHDSFFDLGGHSLLAMRLVWEIRRSLSLELPVQLLFEAPTVAALAERLTTLPKAEGELASAIPRVSRAEPLPLSFAQERLWFLAQLDPASAAYHVPYALRLRGALDEAALREAWLEVVRRHEVLRTTFESVDGWPLQRIQPSPPPNDIWEVQDLSAAPESGRERLAHERGRAAALRPFNLAHGPLARALLLRLGADDHVLLICLHHVVTDGWSMALLGLDLSALYDAFRRGLPSPLPELPLQYADFAVWQRGYVAGEVLAEQLAYWTGRLRGAHTVLAIPIDRPRPARLGSRGDTVRFSLSPTLREPLTALARRENATLFMVLLAGFRALLGRYAGQDDVVVGSSIAGRTRAELEPIVGFFVNTLALRTSLAGDPGFAELVRRERETTLGAYQHQDLPFERLVEELRLPRDLGRHPVFQAMLTVQETAAAPTFGDLVVEPVEGVDESAKFDIALTIVDDGSTLHGGLTFATDLFERATAERMVDHLRTLLQQVAAHPDRRLSEIDLLESAERERILGEWSCTGDVPSADTLHELFERQAERSPESVAIVGPRSSHTYAELDERASRLADQLRGFGVGPETRVALYFDRTPELLVAVLGVLKAGGAFVPLDVAAPAERTRTVIHDSSAAVLLARAGPPTPPPGLGVPVVTVGESDAATSGAPAPAPRRAADPASLAYVMYTSGSSGRPKGVAVSHGALACYLRWACQAYGGGLGSGAPLHSSPASDMTLTSLFVPLLLGEAVTLVPDALDLPAEVKDARTHGGFRLVKLTPSHLQRLVEQPDGGACLRSGNRLVVGGEPLTRALVEHLRRSAPEVEVINEYGPTEAAVACCIHQVRPGTPLGARADVAIGRPTPGSRLYVLDSALRPCPVGLPGELYIGGSQVARGYLGRPGLTADRFLPDPFGGEPGARIYRSGDLARWHGDRTLEMLGRVDAQLKVRGYRVEPAEIEAELSRHPEVVESAVVAAGEGPGRHLVAHVVPRGGRASPELPAVLRKRLQLRLPAYMVPVAIQLTDALPRSAAGKLDRRALEQRTAAVPAQREYVAPRTPEEELLAGIWSEVLGVERVGIHDHFFDLGGHSLVVMQVVARMGAAIGVELPVRALFETPVLEDLAMVIVELQLGDVDEQQLSELVWEISRRAGGEPDGPQAPEPAGSGKVDRP